jgi:hypothetical protein
VTIGPAGSLAYSEWPTFAGGLANSSFDGYSPDSTGSTDPFGTDSSWLGNLQTVSDVFLQNVTGPAGPYIAYTDAADEAGFVSVSMSTY